MSTTTATRDEVLEGRDARFHRFSVESDTGRHYDMLSAELNLGVTGYAVGFATGLLVRFVQTGKVVRNNRLRVRIEFPVDTGDVAGTLEFGTAEGGSVGGWINWDVPNVCWHTIDSQRVDGVGR